MIDKGEAWVMLGAEMRLLRQRSKVSLDAAAAVVGMSKSHLSQVERGRDRPSHELVSRYDQSFGGDGVLTALYVIARAPMVAGRPLSAEPDLPRPRPPLPPPAAAIGIHGERSTFVADVTVPDGSLVGIGEEITKTWRLRNDGDAPWVGLRLVRIGPCDGAAIIASSAGVPVQRTEPGEQVDLTVSVRASLTPGTSIAYWKLADADGHLIFADLRDGLYTLLTAVE